MGPVVVLDDRDCAVLSGVIGSRRCVWPGLAAREGPSSPAAEHFPSLKAWDQRQEWTRQHEWRPRELSGGEAERDSRA